MREKNKSEKKTLFLVFLIVCELEAFG
jgi:hypothetical protein